MAGVTAPRQFAQQAPVVTFHPKSSFLAALEYDATNLTLTSHMLKGGIYQHKFVTPGEWMGLMTSQNHGSTWSRMIRGKKASVIVKVVRSPKSQLKRHK